MSSFVYGLPPELARILESKRLNSFPPLNLKVKEIDVINKSIRGISILLLTAAGSAMAAPIPTSTVLSLSNSSLTLGIPVELFVSIVPPASGTLQFYDGSEIFATVQSANGFAEMTHSFGIGLHTLSATFLGTTTYKGSTSIPQVFITSGVQSTSTQIYYPKNVPTGLGGKVSSSGPLAPAGTLTFEDNSNPVGTAPLVANASVHSLKPQTKFQVGDYPDSVAVGDFNNDGVPDIVVSNQGGGNIGVLIGKMGPLNQITYGFEPQVVYATDPIPLAVAVGDFNGDGLQDIAVACSTRLLVFLGVGDGTFGPAVASNQIPAAFSIAVGDFNRDGILDIAVPNFFNSELTVAFGNGYGAFPNPKNYEIGPPGGSSVPMFVAAADLNNDGILDLVTGSGSQDLSVLIGHPDGTFAAQQIYPVGHGPSGVALADFNGDGLIDVAVSNFADQTVGVLLNLGSGVLAGQVTYAAHGKPKAMAVGDLNGDGFPDLVTVNAPTISVFLNDKNGTFTFTQNATTGTGPLGITIADVNRDGIQDVVVTNSLDNGGSMDSISVLVGSLAQSAQGVITVFDGEPGSEATINYSGDTFHNPSTVSAPYRGPQP